MTDRYQGIESVTFGAVPLPLPVAARITRRGEPAPGIGDCLQYSTSVETNSRSLSAELTVRGTAAAEGLSIGQKGDLSISIRPTDGVAVPRTIVLYGAVLVSVELSYSQSAMAEARLRFLAEASDGSQEPFTAEDQQ